jgi:hypothetical protein
VKQGEERDQERRHRLENRQLGGFDPFGPKLDRGGVRLLNGKEKTDITLLKRPSSQGDRVADRQDVVSAGREDHLTPGAGETIRSPASLRGACRRGSGSA